MWRSEVLDLLQHLNTSPFFSRLVGPEVSFAVDDDPKPIAKRTPLALPYPSIAEG